MNFPRPMAVELLPHDPRWAAMVEQAGAAFSSALAPVVVTSITSARPRSRACQPSRFSTHACSRDSSDSKSAQIEREEAEALARFRL